MLLTLERLLRNIIENEVLNESYSRNTHNEIVKVQYYNDIALYY
jgi:hypothetical protein